MIIQLDSSLKPIIRREGGTVEQFATALGESLNEGKRSWNNKKQGYDYSGAQYVFRHADMPATLQRTQQGFLGLLSDCYSNHLPVAIYPHDLWFLALSEIATYVNKNSEACRTLFTTAPAGAPKKEIIVDGFDSLDVHAVMDQLRALVPVNTDSFLPSLESATPLANVAMAGAFCDMVQSYYSYMTFCCGLPAIKIEGTVADWEALHTATARLLGIFVKHSDVFSMLTRTQTVFAKLKGFKTGEFTDTDWLKGIYTHHNVGSGGELDIDGWIKGFYMGTERQSRLENFLNTKSVVPFKNIDTGLEFKSVYGAFAELQDADGFLYSGYGCATFLKVNPAE